MTDTETHAKPLAQAEKLDWLRLIRSENVGPITFFRLLERFGSAKAALEALPDLAARGGRAGKLRVAPKSLAEGEWKTLDQMGARLVAWGEPEYPPLLAHIDDPPPLIQVLGHVHLLAKRAVAVVGARNASLNGCRLAETLARDLGSGGVMVVSGMARGIDTNAHRGALESGTVAVLGGGVDVVYPKENRDLYDQIRETGALVSEVAPGTQPQARHFPRRNRIISGISRGVVVVEASPKSGSLITARMALEQGREVFAVPGAALDPRARGTNNLIREGAVLTESAEDVFQVLSQQRDPLRERKQMTFEWGTPQVIDEDSMAAARDAVESLLSPSPTALDELYRAAEFPQAVVTTVILELELAGRIERHPGNRVSLLS